MGFYYNTRSPYDVQRDQGRRAGFEGIRNTYEQTKPIRGKRATLDIRPIGERDRTWERVIKVSDTEYYITNNAYTYSDMCKLRGQEYRGHSRAITYKLEGEQETIILHAPRATWREKNADGEFPIDTSGFNAPSNFYFYAFNLPIGLGMENIKSDKFLWIEDEERKRQYYTLTKGDVVVTRKLTESVWKPLVVHRIVKRTIDRKKSKAVREQAKSLLNYIKTMMPLVEHKWSYGNLLDKCARDNAVTLEQILAPQGDDIPTYWFSLAEGYKAQSRSWSYDDGYTFREEAVERNVLKDLYRLTKPFKTIEVPLGEIAHDRYKNWA